MPKSTTTGFTLTALLGAILSLYFLTQVPPTGTGGRLELAALIPLLGGVFLLVAGSGGLLALLLSRRWPLLAGRGALTRAVGLREAYRSQAALRQGILAGLTGVILLLLALAGRLDLAIACIVIVVIGLVESYFQNRAAGEVKRARRGKRE